ARSRRSRPGRTVTPHPAGPTPSPSPRTQTAPPARRPPAGVASPSAATPNTVAGTPVAGTGAVRTPTTAAPGAGSAHPIAFTGTDGNIYLVNTDGSAKRSLAAGLDPAWSPDRSRIAFWRGTGDTSGCENDPGINQAP